MVRAAAVGAAAVTPQQRGELWLRIIALAVLLALVLLAVKFFPALALLAGSGH